MPAKKTASADVLLGVPRVPVERPVPVAIAAGQRQPMCDVHAHCAHESIAFRARFHG